MSSSKFDKSIKTGVHAQLNQLVGEWEGMTKTWFEEDQLADESLMEGTIRPLLGGRFLLHEYEGKLMRKKLKGFNLIGYHLQTKKFQSAWIDNFHMGTGIMFSQSEKLHKKFSVLGHYGAGDQIWRWRSEIKVISRDHIILTAYNISPEGHEAKATETDYKRVK